jgi:hypothetical protein
MRRTPILIVVAVVLGLCALCLAQDTPKAAWLAQCDKGMDSAKADYDAKVAKAQAEYAVALGKIKDGLAKTLSALKGDDPQVDPIKAKIKELEAIIKELKLELKPAFNAQALIGTNWQWGKTPKATITFLGQGVLQTTFAGQGSWKYEDGAFKVKFGVYPEWITLEWADQQHFTSVRADGVVDEAGTRIPSK